MTENIVIYMFSNIGTCYLPEHALHKPVICRLYDWTL